MTDAHRLTLVRAIHTAIYVVMASSTFAVVYAGITGAHGRWLWVAGVLVSIESVIFAASGMKCPLTAVVVRYDATKGRVSDTFFPERITRHTLTVFGPLLALGVLLLAARWLYLGWA